MHNTHHSPRRKRWDRHTRKVAITLQLNDSRSGNVQISNDLSEQLWINSNHKLKTDQGFYIAISEQKSIPFRPRWTILPCEIADKLTDRTVQLSTSSIWIHSLIRDQSDLRRVFSRKKTLLDVVVTPVTPIPLDTIYVVLDHNIEHGRIEHDIRQSAPRKEATIEQNQTTIVRDVLRKREIVHSRDTFFINTRNINSERRIAMTIRACEPVSQGIVCHDTKVVIVNLNLNTIVDRKLKLPANRMAEIDEDTDFHTAAEDVLTTSSHQPVSNSKSENVNIVDESEDSLSDDPEMTISLTSPTFGILNSGFSTTPRFNNGVHTPGSVISNMTSVTLRGGLISRPIILKTQGLTEKIPEQLLQPQPKTFEDDEARIYVEMSILARLGCFSGDWVEICHAEDPNSTVVHNLNISALLGNLAVKISRHVRVYGLPDVFKKASNQPSSPRSHGPAIGQGIKTSSLVYMSPILLLNMDDCPYIQVKAAPALSIAPIALEASLMKIQSPLSMEKSIDSNVFLGLLSHLEAKQRLVKTGDLIAIPVDENMSRSLPNSTDTQNKHLSSCLQSQEKTGAEVIWFEVGTLTGTVTEDKDVNVDWGGLMLMDHLTTKIHQSGTERRRNPSTNSSTWPYYLGIWSMPKEKAYSYLTSPPPRYVSSTCRRVKELVSTAISFRALQLGVPPLFVLLYSSQRQSGKSSIISQACDDLGVHKVQIDAYDITTEDENSMIGTFESRVERALQCGNDNICFSIRHVEAITSLKMITSIKTMIKDVRILIATTTDRDRISNELKACFTHEIEVFVPDENEREAILRSIVTKSNITLAADVNLKAIAIKTAALVAGDLVDVVERAITLRSIRLESLASKYSIALKDIEIAGGESIMCVTSNDFTKAVDEARKNYGDSIGAPKIPNVQWSDVGGLSHVKATIMETIQLPLSNPELFSTGLKKRSGILFYGPPGTGKTLLAKAIATEFNLNFFSIKGPELLNMYIGESEANVRRVFQRARDARPCIIFFDELDSVAPKRGNQGDSGGVMDRIVSQLLAELDGMSGGNDDNGSGAGVFVIGATNRPDLLDQALLRPGRFDKMIYLGIPDTDDKQLKIMQALTRKFSLSSSLSLSNFVSTLPFTYTGADFYALCSDAMLKAITRCTRNIDDKVDAMNSLPPKIGGKIITTAQFFDHYATDSDLEVLVGEEDFHLAEGELVLSVSREELAHYERIRREFEGTGTSKGETDRPGNIDNTDRDGFVNEQERHNIDTSSKGADLEAWQAKKIEEMIKNGFSDGSLARNDPRVAKVSSSNGNMRSVSDHITADTEQEEYIVRTSKLNLNHQFNNSTNGDYIQKSREDVEHVDGGKQKESENTATQTASSKAGQYNLSSKMMGKRRATMSLFGLGKGKKTESSYNNDVDD